MKYNIQYFWNKARNIPDEMWYIGNYMADFNKPEGPRCWLGHCSNSLCGNHATEAFEESAAITEISHKHNLNFAIINDDNVQKHPCVNNMTKRFIGEAHLDTPKKRIIAALEWVAEQEGVVLMAEHKDITKSLAILPINETSDVINSKSISYEHH